MADLSFRWKEDGSIDVSSHLTRGRTATVWFSSDNKPHVAWAIISSYRQGLSDEDIFTALAAITQETGRNETTQVDHMERLHP